MTAYYQSDVEKIKTTAPAVSSEQRRCPFGRIILLLVLTFQRKTDRLPVHPHPLRTPQNVTEHKPGRTTGLPGTALPISEITGNVFGLTQDNKVQGSLDVKWPTVAQLLGKEMISGKTCSIQCAHLKMNLFYCLQQELKCSFKSVSVLVLTPTRYHFGRGKMAKHLKKVTHLWYHLPVLLSRARSSMVNLPFLQCNKQGNGKTLFLGLNITRYHQRRT